MNEEKPYTYLRVTFAELKLMHRCVDHSTKSVDVGGELHDSLSKMREDLRLIIERFSEVEVKPTSPSFSPDSL